MIELAGLTYGFGKDLAKAVKDFLAWEDEKKLVDMKWLEESGFKEKAEADGYHTMWSLPDKIETRLLKGYEILYEIDKVKRVRRRLVLRDGLTLLGIKNS